MKKFEYKAWDRNGELVKGAVEAECPHDALQQLTGAGILLAHIDGMNANYHTVEMRVEGNELFTKKHAVILWIVGVVSTMAGVCGHIVWWQGLKTLCMSCVALIVCGIVAFLTCAILKEPLEKKLCIRDDGLILPVMCISIWCAMCLGMGSWYVHCHLSVSFWTVLFPVVSILLPLAVFGVVMKLSIPELKRIRSTRVECALQGLKSLLSTSIPKSECDAFSAKCEEYRKQFNARYCERRIARYIEDKEIDATDSGDVQQILHQVMSAVAVKERAAKSVSCSGRYESKASDATPHCVLCSEVYASDEIGDLKITIYIDGRYKLLIGETKKEFHDWKSVLTYVDEFLRDHPNEDDDSGDAIGAQEDCDAKAMGMLYAKWSGRDVKIYQVSDNSFVRAMKAKDDVTSVQCSGEGDDAYISIALVNGHTEVYRGDGRFVRYC